MLPLNFARNFVWQWNVSHWLGFGQRMLIGRIGHGYKLFHDGHVEDLQCCRLENKPFSYFQFKIKPAERAKTEDGQSTYNGFFTLKSSAGAHAA